MFTCVIPKSDTPTAITVVSGVVHAGIATFQQPFSAYYGVAKLRPHKERKVPLHETDKFRRQKQVPFIRVPSISPVPTFHPDQRSSCTTRWPFFIPSYSCSAHGPLLSFSHKSALRPQDPQITSLQTNAPLRYGTSKYIRYQQSTISSSSMSSRTMQIA
jgi:hypothetical protein